MASPTSQERILLKIIILGGSNVGKTSIMKRYILGQFTGTRQVTVGVDFMSKQTIISERPVTIQLWDTAGQERFHNGGLTNHFFRGADGALLVYDVTSSESFKQVKQWEEELHKKLPEDEVNVFPVVVVANKVDVIEAMRPGSLQDGCLVPTEDHNMVSPTATNREEIPVVGAALVDLAEEWCRDKNYGHVQTSAKDGIGVEVAIQAISMLAVDMKTIRIKRQLSTSKTFQDTVDFDRGHTPRGSCCKF